jgi:hypothetical protein
MVYYDSWDSSASIVTGWMLGFDSWQGQEIFPYSSTAYPVGTAGGGGGSFPRGKVARA